MKKTFQIFFTLFLTIAWINATAQDASVTNIEGSKVPTEIMNPLAECTGTGSLIYDDGTFENGYGWNPSVTDGRFVSLFTPSAYPWQFNTFCLSLTRLAAGNPNFTFDIVMYENSGGTPGNQLGIVSGVTATNIPIWTTLAFYDFDISTMPPLASGSVFIGIKYNPSLVSSPHYSGADESTTTTLHPGYAWSGTSWGTIQSFFAAYRAMSYRTLGSSGPPCPVGAPTNPFPANGATNVPISGNTATWTNGAGTVNVELWFGPQGSLTQVYSGAAISSFALPTLNYATTYGWYVKCGDGTCFTQGPTWTFTTMQNPLLVIDTVDVYPQNANYWTGTTTASAKTEVSLMNILAAAHQAWAKFDVSLIQAGATITSVRVNWYIDSQNCPYFYINALPIDPVTANAATLYAAITGGVHYYTFNTCPVTGWNTVLLAGNVNTDLAASLPSGWFAISFFEYESSTYYFNAQGWAQANKPYLRVIFQYIVPVELTSFTATANDGDIELSWITATETNNQGFEVQRSNGGEFEAIAFVEGHGTTTEVQAYSYTDRNVTEGSYSYRLKQIDFDGSFEYSNVVEVDVSSPAVYALEQNYPNPFNPSTKIAFRLAVDSKVSLKVFDVLGQEVATLVNTNLVAGAHNVDFNGSSLNSGVYFYRIEATGINGTNFVDVKKMILTK